MSALFANMVIQQTNMALMFLGKMPHPETGKTMTDVETAQLFIDQLEMLEGKTKGNLSKQEESLLKQSLMALRLAFVEVIDHGGKSGPEENPAATKLASETQPQRETTPTSQPVEGSQSTDESESRKKFSKKY